MKETQIRSIKIPHKKYVKVKHQFERPDQLDAYFSPSGILYLQFVMDGRRYEVVFGEQESRRLAKRLCVDTIKRALFLLGAAEVPREQV